jgi:hypothetical protein
MDPDPGGPNTCGSGGSGKGAMIITILPVYRITYQFFIADYAKNSRDGPAHDNLLAV